MAAIGLNVEQVVDDVGRRSGEREAAEGGERGEQFAGGYSVGQEQGNEDEQVLGPLMQAQQP